MPLRCTRCHRPLTSAHPVSYRTATGSLLVGPVCAQRMGLVRCAEKRQAVRAVVRVHVADENQRDLFEAAR